MVHCKRVSIKIIADPSHLLVLDANGIELPLDCHWGVLWSHSTTEAEIVEWSASLREVGQDVGPVRLATDVSHELRGCKSGSVQSEGLVHPERVHVPGRDVQPTC